MRKKPDFALGMGAWVDPQFLPATVRRELLLHLVDSKLTKAQKDSLVIHANDMAQAVMDGSLQGAQAQQKEIKAIAANARRLLASLKALSQPAKESLEANADYLAHKAKRQIRQWDEGFLSAAWDYTDELESCAEYTVKKYKIDRTSKPAQKRGREMVSILAEHILVVTGALPPKERDSWFAAFVKCLGKHLRLPHGPRIVSGGIQAKTR